MSDFLWIIVQVILFIVLSPLIQGIVKKTKALLQSRKGPGLFQGYYDLHKYFKKSLIISEDASWITKITPYIVFSTAVFNSIWVVTFFTSQIRMEFGDILLMIYVFALARLFITLTGLDAGSSFGGMGSSREIAISVLAEPALFLAVLSYIYKFESLSLDQIALQFSDWTNMWFHPYVIFSFLAIMILIITETGRLPVDNPDTHLELTMVHEGMVLELTGRHLALVFWSHWIKQMILLSIVVSLFFPFSSFTGGWVIILMRMMLFLLKIIGLAVVLGMIETAVAKLRFFRIPGLLKMSMILSLLAFITQWMA